MLSPRPDHQISGFGPGATVGGMVAAGLAGPARASQGSVRDYVLGQDVTGPFLDRLTALLELLVPAYVAEGKSYLTIAFGCTGGRHRSVAIAERVAAVLRDQGVRPTVTHRDIDR